MADQRNVRSVQRGNERQPLALRHHASQQSAHGMWNGVMHVQQVQRGLFRHFVHTGGKGERIRRMVEQWIGGDLDFMEINPLVSFAQPDRHGVTDEMDFVAARGQLDPQFRCYHSGAAIRRIACDADLHGTSMTVAAVCFMQQAMC